MPLNIRDNDGSSGAPAPPPPPIMHGPENGSSHTGRTIGIIFAILVFIAAVFLLYTYGAFDSHKSAPAVATNTPPAEQKQAPPPAPAATEQAQQAPEQAPSQNTHGASPSTTTRYAALSSGSGQITIYIGSYKERAVAEAEVGRWHDAGYQAFVKEASGWFQVQLGRFENRADTRELIDTLKDGFEGGYWVGPA